MRLGCQSQPGSKPSHLASCGGICAYSKLLCVREKHPAMPMIKNMMAHNPIPPIISGRWLKRLIKTTLTSALSTPKLMPIWISMVTVYDARPVWLRKYGALAESTPPTTMFIDMQMSTMRVRRQLEPRKQSSSETAEPVAAISARSASMALMIWSNRAWTDWFLGESRSRERLALSGWFFCAYQ